MKRALILDFETTGIDPAMDRIVELGMVDYSLEHHAVIRCGSAVVDTGSGNAAEHVNGIPPSMLGAYGIPEATAFELIRRWATASDVVLAHNASFDSSFCPPELRTIRPWCCTCHDIEWPTRAPTDGSSPLATDFPRARPGRSLVATALDLGLGVADAHRALADCLLMARCLARVHERGHDVQAMLARGLRPKARFVPESRAYDPEANKTYKAHGFQWNPDDKVWSRTMAREDATLLPFRVQEIAQ